MKDDMTDNEIVIAKSRGVALQVEVFSNRHLAPVFPFFSQENTPGTCIEAHNVVNHAPHLWVYKSTRLAEHGSNVLPSPFKFTAVARYAESHFSGIDSDPRVHSYIIRKRLGTKKGVKKGTILLLFGWK